MQKFTQLQVGMTIMDFGLGGYDHLTPVCRRVDKLSQKQNSMRKIGLQEDFWQKMKRTQANRTAITHPRREAIG